MSVNEWYGPSRATMLAREFDKNHPGEILPAQDRLNTALEQAHAIRQVGWRVVLRAEEHVWKDAERMEKGVKVSGWDWRTRFEVTGFLWRHALELCKDRILGV